MSGPKASLSLSCHDCEYCHQEYERVQGDSGYNVICTHPIAEGKKDRHRWDTWRVPCWCPFPEPALVPAEELIALRDVATAAQKLLDLPADARRESILAVHLAAALAALAKAREGR